MFIQRDAIAKAASHTAPAKEEWAGQGMETGTRRSVIIYGESAEDVRAKALGRAYTVHLHVVWKLNQ